MAVILDPDNPSQLLYFQGIEAAASSLGMHLTRADVRNADDIERAMNAFAQQPNGAFVVVPTAVTIFHRDLIIALAARYRVPAIYLYRVFAASGGFISYGVDLSMPFLAHRVEERSDVGVQYEAHLPAVDPDTERIQRIMRAASRPEPIRESRGNLPRRSRSAARPPPVGRSCPPGPRPRAGAAGHPAWECRPAATAVPDTLPVGPGHASPRYCARGLPRSPSTSADPRRGRRSALSS